MSSDMLHTNHPVLMFHKEGQEAGGDWVRRVCFQAASKQSREELPNRYSHPDKWKGLSTGQERQDQPRAGRVVGVGAVTITSLTSGVLEGSPELKDLWGQGGVSRCTFLEFLRSLGADDSALFLSVDSALGPKCD